MKILFVDDYADLASEMANGLRRFGYETIYAKSAQEALEIIKKESPDFIFSDVRMPGMSGLKFCEEVKKISTAPVVFLTAYETPAYRKAGALDCLEKPISFAEISTKLKGYECAQLQN